jgi:hypothetical protein
MTLSVGLERNRRLTLDDIVDHRAYEREREAFRLHVRARKEARRVQVGELITFTFECADTVRFQVQEMARAERLLRDEQIQAELDTYNPLIPDARSLSATMFVELTTPDALRKWLPRLVGIERCVRLEPNGAEPVGAVLEEAHEAQLTRDDITASVHYLRFVLDRAQQAAFGVGSTRLVIDHPSYQHSTTLSARTVAELGGDLAG